MKILNRLLAIVASPITIGILITVVVTYISIEYYTTSNRSGQELSPSLKLLHTLHQKSVDLRMNLRGPQLGDPRVGVLTVDEKAIEQEGRWPWPREKIARAIDNAVKHGAKILAFDIIFSEPDPNSSIASLTRLRRQAETRNLSTAELNSLIEEEIEKANSDKYLAQTIERHADHLVMGSYAELHEVRFQPHQDLCLQHLHERSTDFGYWDKENIRAFVTDKSEQQLPDVWKQHLEMHITRLETIEIDQWFSKNSTKKQAFGAALTQHGLELDEEGFAPIAQLWLSNQHSNLKSLLSEIQPALQEDGTFQALNRSIEDVITDKERATLIPAQRFANENYCGRFLTQQDELLNPEAYAKKFGESESFAELSWKQTWPQIQATVGRFKDLEFENGLETFKSEHYHNRIRSVGRWWLNIPLFAAVTKHTGYFNADQDSDGTIRRSMLFMRRGNTYMPSLPLKAFMAANNYGFNVLMRPSERDVDSKIISEFNIIDDEGNHLMRIPVDGDGRLPINYSGPRKMFPYASLADLLNDKPTLTIEWRAPGKDGRFESEQTTEMTKDEFFKDKLFVVGATATGIFDLRVTPFEEDFPGVETHTNVLSNLLVEQQKALKSAGRTSAPGFLIRHPQEELYMLGTLLGLGLVLSALLAHLGAVSGLFLTSATVAGISWVDRYILFSNGIVVSILLPLALVSTIYVTLTFYKYFTEERKKRELKGTFEKYVSPAIVAEVLSDPSKIELGGRKVDLTVLFSDVRGFTTISEKLDPRALSDLLNSYLTPMTELVFKNKGTLDKYMGDAIMAFFGAPIHYPDHAKYACRCALQHIEKLKELQQIYRSKGLPEIDIGIGLNTGEMSVGNMGSDTVRSYTVMGDAVNLGSRLEGINKQYGTRIIISEFTQKVVEDDFVTREIDWVRVKGKVLPVRIFELVGEKENAPAAEVLEMLKWFRDGFNLYHDRNFDKAIESFNQALNINPADPCSKLYIERCYDYVKEPPQADWDGVFTMTSK